MTGLLPFRIEFSDRAIDDLHRRIDATRWPAIPFDTGWTAGTNDRVLRELVRYWRQDFDWFAVEEQLNRRAHVRGDLRPEWRGEALHAIVAAGPGSEHRPAILMLHGWPSSFVEYLDATDLLTTSIEGAPAFDVVVPSLPGYGFSDAAQQPGMHPGRIAERMHVLMQTLGYDRYFVQGGDWGASVGTALALQQPEAVRGLHINFVPRDALPPAGAAMTDAERDYLEQRARFQAKEGAYSSIQRTRPQSLAYAQQDSPVGLLAWQLEKFWAWTDHARTEGADLWASIDRDRVLTNATLYWLTGTVYSAARLYYESEHAADRPISGRVEVPTGYARFPRDSWAAPREALERGYALRHYSEPPAGGHFAALEQPALFAADVSRFFQSLS